jgi:hypothetical protein
VRSEFTWDDLRNAAGGRVVLPALEAFLNDARKSIEG